MRRTNRTRGLVAIFVMSVVASMAVAQQQNDQGIPPPPAENFAPVTEAEILAKLPDRERALIERETDLKARFDAYLTVSDLRLAEIGTRLSARTGPVLDALLLYEGVLRVADQLIRSPQAKAPPRDKRYKQFERKLTKQLSTLKPLVSELSYDESTTGSAILETVKRLRAAALNTALDSEILNPEQQ